MALLRLPFAAILSCFLGTTATAQVAATGQETNLSPAATVKVTFQTTPAGRSVIVDGTSRITPYNATWTTGTNHTVNTSSPQSGGSGTRYVFSSWSDGLGQSHSVTAPASNTTYTATFSTEYYLTMSATPSSGGTVSPTSGWKSKGQVISINATANSGYNFTSWSGTGTGSYTGTNKSASVTMNSPIGETANFGVLQPILSVTPTDRSVSSSAGTTTFSVVNAGSGTMNWTARSDTNWATITSGSSGTNTGTITVSYTANQSSINARAANITVTALGATGSPQVVTLVQSPTSVSELVVDTTTISDDFNGTTLNTGLWTFRNPLGDATLAVGGSELSLSVPGGVRHEPWTSGNTAPRIMQNVDSSMNVDVWTLRFNSLPAGTANTIPMQGMIFEQDTNNYVRIDVSSDAGIVNAFAAGFRNGPDSPKVFFLLPLAATTEPIWMRTTRSGSLWRVYISIDGATNLLSQGFEWVMAVRRIGIFAGNAGSAPQPYTCVVDYFEGALPAEAFLVSPDSGISGVARPVILAWDSSMAAESYQLQIASDVGFGTILYDSMIVGTSATISSLQATGQPCWWRVRGTNQYGSGQFSSKRSFTISTTGVNAEDGLPGNFALEQNYPNPFNPLTVINYTIAGAGGRGSGVGEAGAGGSGLGARKTMLVIYDVLGRQVATLVDEVKAPGLYEVVFDGSKLSSGVYVYRLTAGAFVSSRKMVLLK